MDIKKILSELTLQEKAALVAGTDFMYTNPLPRLGVASVRMSDGPHGLRVQTEDGDNGVTGSLPATAFPTAACLASSWNPSNAYKVGEAIARECLHYGVNVVLGPALNIKRNPRCGRNFEYFSEDPLLAGEMALSQVQGIQSLGVGACIKHFALNNSENYRFMSDSIADARAIREIYLKAFEPVIRRGKPHAVMCAYNKINGTYCSENKWLLSDILRDEWGFDGAVMTDWGATRDRVLGVKAGLDLEMPGDTAYCRKRIIDGVKSGELDVEELDKAVTNVLNLVARYEGQVITEADFVAHNALAEEVAEDSAVLMKNDGVLPLSKSEKLLVVGELFDKMRYQGAGSSMINPTFLTSPMTAFKDMGVDFEYLRGYEENKTNPNNDLIAQAVVAAENYDKVIVFAGLTDYAESEGGDRPNMLLPENQLALIDALVKTGKKVVVVLYGGSPVELPFADKVSAILNMYLPGQGGGAATAKLLFGDVNPSGKLAETWAKSYGNVPFGAEFGTSANEVYKESIYVGYRYYLTAGKEVRYPFGHGLSYTAFEYRNMTVTEDCGKITVSCDVYNMGCRDGAEIVQLYVKAPKSSVFKPEAELRGFSKVFIRSGECEHVEISVNKDNLSFWDMTQCRFVTEDGEYEFRLCSDCMTVKLSNKLYLQGDSIQSKTVNAYMGAELSLVTNETFEEMSGIKIPPLPQNKPFTTETRFSEANRGFMGKIIYTAIMSMAKKDLKRAKKLPDGPERDNKIKGAIFLRRIFESSSLRSMSMNAGRRMPFNFAEGLMHLINGRVFKGIKCFLTKIKLPPLPKDER